MKRRKLLQPRDLDEEEESRPRQRPRRQARQQEPATRLNAFAAARDDDTSLLTPRAATPFKPSPVTAAPPQFAAQNAVAPGVPALGASPLPSLPTFAQASPGDYSDLSANATYSRGQFDQPVQGLVFHHTGGRGDAQGVINTLNQRGLGVHYVMDRDGKIYQTLPSGARGAHMKPSEIGNGLSNANTIGIEVIANDDSDITPAQIAASRSFRDYAAQRYGFDPQNVYGHGTLNTHKQATEGSTIVNALRQQASVQPGMQMPPGTNPASAPSLLRKFEGYSPTAYWDKTAYRIGYGSDTITDPATGQVRRVTPNDRINEQMAEADLARRIPQFQQTVASQYPGFNNLPEPTKAALTSVAYNYGRLPGSVVNALNTGDMTAVANSVAALPANADRRAQEASVIRGGPGFRGMGNPMDIAGDMVAPAAVRSEEQAVPEQRRGPLADRLPVAPPVNTTVAPEQRRGPLADRLPNAPPVVSQPPGMAVGPTQWSNQVFSAPAPGANEAVAGALRDQALREGRMPWAPQAGSGEPSPGMGFGSLFGGGGGGSSPPSTATPQQGASLIDWLTKPGDQIRRTVGGWFS